MLAFVTILLPLISLISQTDALYVASGSPCLSTCNATAGGTWLPDLVCSTSDFDATSKGQLLKNCIQCISSSTYINSTYTDGNTDQFWELFHLKYVQQYCLTEKSTPHLASVNACTSACTSLTPVLTNLWISGHPFSGQYDYCTQNSSVYPRSAGDCAKCLQGQQESVYIGNFMDTMNQACSSRPYIANGNLVATSRSLFATSVLGAITPSLSKTTTGATATSNTKSDTKSTSTGNTQPTASSGATITSIPGQASATADGTSGTTSGISKGGLGTGAVAGIAVMATLLAIAVVAGLVFFLWRRKRSTKTGQADSTHNLNNEPYSTISKDKKHANHGSAILEKPANGFDGQIHEAPDYHDEVVAELSGSPQRFVELPAAPHP